MATSPQLSQARSLDTYAFIEEILRDQAVLILGYSGTGDIDIAPHLGKQEKVLLWEDLKIDTAKVKPPNQTDFICDLSLDTPGTSKEQRRNLLLDLAASYGWRPLEEIEPGQVFQWKQDLIDWTGQIPLEQLRAFITSFMSWRTSWPHVHIAYHGLRERKTYKDELEYALSTN